MNRDEAGRLLNKTYPYPGDPGYYIGELAVSHQLHCLNRLHQDLFVEYYKDIYGPEEFEEDGNSGWGHISHCLEIVGQALTCASDVSVIP
ncbi:tat pathway signal sequence [Penicillium angulare]|uniref:tat pathway signal sequence n=1 Tax=Penicillium angulare TaxID=116970 RepID=UPI0025426045|nr:tat pathway signal sequence [Penicillium angulare]KAJ5273129.1 tat pathway signal sequence [Penicillium angulare]